MILSSASCGIKEGAFALVTLSTKRTDTYTFVNGISTADTDCKLYLFFHLVI